MGAVELKLGRYQQATSHFEQGRDLCREAADRAGKAEALNGLGGVLLATGQPHRALTQHSNALILAGQIHDLRRQAAAHNGLGHVHDATGDVRNARDHWKEALALYATLGAPEAEQVREQLIAAGNGSQQ